MKTEFNLSDKIVTEVQDARLIGQGYREWKSIDVKNIKEFIQRYDKILIQKYAEEKTTHKNHRVQSLLVELRQELIESAGSKLVDNSPYSGGKKSRRIASIEDTPEVGGYKPSLLKVRRRAGSIPAPSGTCICGHHKPIHNVVGKRGCQAFDCKCKKFEVKKCGDRRF